MFKLAAAGLVAIMSAGVAQAAPFGGVYGFTDLKDSELTGGALGIEGGFGYEDFSFYGAAEVYDKGGNQWYILDVSRKVTSKFSVGVSSDVFVVVDGDNTFTHTAYAGYKMPALFGVSWKTKLKIKYSDNDKYSGFKGISLDNRFKASESLTGLPFDITAGADYDWLSEDYSPNQHNGEVKVGVSKSFKHVYAKAELKQKFVDNKDNPDPYVTFTVGYNF